MVQEVDVRFFPSKFGNDVDSGNVVEPAKLYSKPRFKSAVLLKQKGYLTLTCPATVFAGYFLILPTLRQSGIVNAPPRDKVIVFGDGNTKGVFNKEVDVGTFTLIKAIGKTLEKVYLPLKENILKDIQESPLPSNMVLAVYHSIFVKGDQTNFVIESSSLWKNVSSNSFKQLHSKLLIRC
ncbi:hypothetical protein ACOSQ2_011249 [Xanthoceras sorbifolium]